MITLSQPHTFSDDADETEHDPWNDSDDKTFVDGVALHEAGKLKNAGEPGYDRYGEPVEVPEVIVQSPPNPHCKFTPISLT